MDIPAEQLSVLESQARAGDDAAKALLADIGQPKAPETKPEGATPGESGPADQKPEAPKAPDAPGSEVDQGRERSGNEDKRPSKIETIRELRAKNRELKRALEDYDKRLKAVEERPAPPLPTGPKQVVSDEDELKSLLEKPTEFLSKRESALVEKVLKAVDERIAEREKKLAERASLQGEASEAFNMVKGIKNFDMQRDEEEFLDMMEETGLAVLAKIQPRKAAILAKKLWESRGHISPEAVRDKSAAASGGAGAGKPTPVITKSPIERLRDLNARVQALDPNSPEFDKILDEIGALEKSLAA